jgi:hypothetical protein
MPLRVAERDHCVPDEPFSALALIGVEPFSDELERAERHRSRGKRKLEPRGAVGISVAELDQHLAARDETSDRSSGRLHGRLDDDAL